MWRMASMLPHSASPTTRALRRNLIDLLLLASLWGGSFLFMRIAVPQFGPLPLMAVRCAIGAAILLPFLAWRGGLPGLAARPGALLVVGFLNSALPFVLFGYATLSLTAGMASVLNATTPLFAAVVAYFWLGDRPDRRRVIGLAIGFGGVLWLVSARGSVASSGGLLPVLAALGASVSYGVSASFTRRHLTGVSSLVLAAGSQLGAILVLLVPALLTWPSTPPDASAWLAALALGAACTGLAYMLFFRLMNRAGVATATSVTFLVPMFAVLWGGLFLGEQPSLAMLLGGVVILAGTALASGVQWPRRAAREA